MHELFVKFTLPNLNFKFNLERVSFGNSLGVCPFLKSTLPSLIFKCFWNPLFQIWKNELWKWFSPLGMMVDHF